MKTHTQSPILSALQSIHDDAAHALGTEAEPQDRLSVARQDLEVIRETARDAIEEEGKRTEVFVALLAALKRLSTVCAINNAEALRRFHPHATEEQLFRWARDSEPMKAARAAIALAEGRTP